MIGTGEVKYNSESKRKFHQYVEKVTGSANYGQSSSSCDYFRVRTSSKEEIETSTYVEEVRQLKKRLTDLEEETNTMKQEMLRNIAERKTLLGDVYRQLKVIQFSLHPENQTFKYKFCKIHDEGRLDGLSQVLYEDWNPSVVVRGGSKAYSMAAPGPVESTLTSILSIEYEYDT